ncbi:HET domain containing protein [Hyaloscypha variabilis]
MDISKPPLPPRPSLPPLPPRPAYPYRSLQPGEIRLLRVRQGAVTELVCDLEIAHITRPPSYEALSYCWGDQNDRIPIDCNGSGGLAITRNLHSALLSLRLPNRPRLIWADAICINQEDVKERSSQILLMKDIYRLAFAVIVWLGGPIEVDGKELWPIPPLLEAAEKNLKRTELPLRHGNKSWVQRVFRSDYTINGDLFDKEWNAIIKSLVLLLHRPWFLRTWIIQEVAFATRAIVTCGKYSVNWEDFYRAVSYAIDLDYLSATSPEMSSSIQNIERARWNLAHDKYPRPLDFLASCRIFLATDPRDKVFGLYSLFSPSDLAVLKLQPDYELDVFKVYTQSALDCIATERTLDILSFGGQDGLRVHEQLPTWVPDWACPDNALPLQPRFLSTFSFGQHQWACTWQSATGASHPILELTEDPKVIKLSGYVFDKVKETGGVLEREYLDSLPGHPIVEVFPKMEENYDVFWKWEGICGVPNNTPYCTGEAAWDVYWKTLYADSYPHGDAEQTLAAFEKWYSLFRDLRNAEEHAESRTKEIMSSESSMARKVAESWGVYGKAMWKVSKYLWNVVVNINKLPPSRILAFHRSFFKTERGYVGISSPNVKEGDCVALFQGGKMPLVIREVEEYGLSRIVGDAYIHGIMNGEEFDASRCSMLSIG